MTATTTLTLAIVGLMVYAVVVSIVEKRAGR